MSIRTRWVLAVAAGLIVAGCGSQQEPATRAVEAAQAALGAVREEASQFAPEQLKAAEEALERIQGNLKAGDYPNVLTAAPTLTKQVDELKTAVAEGKSRLEGAIAEAKDIWPSLSEDLPKQAEALKLRLEALGKMKSLPEGIDAANLEYSRKGYEELSTDWAAAQADFAAGKYTDAASKANAARRRAMDLMARLKVTPRPSEAGFGAAAPAGAAASGAAAQRAQELAGVRPGGRATCSGVPSATIRPPPSPPSGPRSMIQSAVLITSRLCSMTTTCCPGHAAGAARRAAARCRRSAGRWSARRGCRACGRWRAWTAPWRA